MRSMMGLLLALALGCGSSGGASSSTLPSSTGPAPIVPGHGTTAWAVYVALGDTMDDPSVRAALDLLDDRAITSFASGELGCDVGASEALGQPTERLAVAVYFATEDDARSFASTLDPPAVGVVSVQVMCAD